MQRIWLRVCTVLTALGTAVALAPAAPAAAGVDKSYETIPGHEDTDLSAYVITPDTDGPHPLLVFPAPWGMHGSIYVGAAQRLAEESGYQVVSYTARGFWDSDGGIEVAGPEDIADAQAVIDWALDNTDADPSAIGMGGISYGAGISLLTAANDDRVGAVGAMSGWSDLEESLYPNETINVQAAEALLLAGDLLGDYGETLDHVASEYRQGNIQPALDMAPERSAVTHLDELNANQPAVMIAHPWNDGIFPPRQITEFYSELELPKRLMLTPGDHATPEAFGAAGLPNTVWEDLGRWFDHHLTGADNGIDAEDPVHIQENSKNGAWSSHPDWESVTETTETHYLSEPRRSLRQWQATGGMEPEPDTGWDYRIRAGLGTTAHSGTLLVSGALLQFLDLPTGVSLPLVNRYRAGVWTGPEYPDGATVSGTPRAQITVTPTAAEQSLYFYLFSTNRHGTGALVSHQPYTLRDVTPDEPTTVDVDLQPVVRDIPAGHHLTLIVDTGDPRYTDESEFGERVEFGSPEEEPAHLNVPLG
ncbi:CocE/NonD family hydrolase [Lipingzhangella sp. LS1_29]|uniref:CocE/NonD family hydrolase n=1 Tax=Lipingzhangella rawalii TaxID=2055835 RepID=A0ABU2HB03_9ACTN|nr:CocE/NonD family hydrolase [Lipingzhangella rawalii]MDS1272498.1 CocE/NonD family hydrolase [Lipingzhangella rawalii]